MVWSQIAIVLIAGFAMSDPVEIKKLLDPWTNSTATSSALSNGLPSNVIEEESPVASADTFAQRRRRGGGGGSGPAVRRRIPVTRPLPAVRPERFRTGVVRPGVSRPADIVRPGIVRPTPGSRRGLVRPGITRQGVAPPSIRYGRRPAVRRYVGPRPGYRPGIGPRRAYRPAVRWHAGYRPARGWHPYYRPYRPYYPYRHWRYYTYRPWVWSSWGALAGWVGARATEPIVYDYSYPSYYYTTETMEPYPETLILGEGAVEQTGKGTIPETPTTVDVSSRIDEITALADRGNMIGAEEPIDEWMPVGIFGVVSDDSAEIDVSVQLAISKAGRIAGTYHNRSAEVTSPLTGAVDSKSQRAAWRIDEGGILMETSLKELTEASGPVLVIFDDKTGEIWQLRRLTKQQAIDVGMPLNEPSTEVTVPQVE